MAVIVESIMAEDIELGTGPTTKTHPASGTLNGFQVSLSTFSIAGAAGTATTGSWNPGSVVAGSYATTTLTVPGAAFGDKVLVSLTTLTTDPLFLSAHVSAVNQVTVVLLNTTIANVVIGSGTLSVLVFRHR